MSTMSVKKKTGYNTIPFIKFKYVYIYLEIYTRGYHWVLRLLSRFQLFSSLCLWYFLIFYDEYTETHKFGITKTNTEKKRASCLSCTQNSLMLPRVNPLNYHLGNFSNRQTILLSTQILLFLYLRESSDKQMQGIIILRKKHNLITLHEQI